MDNNETFVAGNKYRVYLSIIAQNGCKPDPEGVKYFINGKEAEQSLFAIYYEFTAVPKVKELRFTIPEPIIGKVAGKMTIETDIKNAYPSESSTVDTAGQWLVSKDGKTYENMKSTDKFEAGKYYRNQSVGAWFFVAALAEAFGGTIFNENYAGGSLSDVKLYINEKEVKNEGDNWFYVDFGKL